MTSLDAVCLDAEHAPFDRRSLDLCTIPLKAGNTPAIIRPPSTAAPDILNALDLGADAILAPHILSKQTALDLVERAHFGRGRGYAGSSRAAGYGARSMREHITKSGESTTLIAQIEDAAAVKALPDILTVEAIDGYFIGRADLTVSMGYEDPNHPDILALVEDLCKTIIKAGKPVGMFTGVLAEIPHWRSLGVTLFLLGSDHSFLKQGANNLVKTCSQS